MLNQASVDTVAAARLDDHIGRPLYDGYGFAQLPSFIRSLWGAHDTTMPRAVLGPYAPTRDLVLFLLDGFGWSFFERFADELPFLRRINRDGVVSKLTSQFPSSTAPHMTTLHTELPVGKSGVLEWFYYEPSFGEIFAPLLCATLQPEGPVSVSPDQASAPPYPRHTLYRSLAASGVESVCYLNARYATSHYSNAVMQGACVIPFRTLPEAMVHLTDRMAGPSRSPTFHFVYVDVLDTICHQHGPDSRHLAAEIRALFRLLEDEVAGQLPGRPLVLLTADHGHMAVDPSRTTYVDEVSPDLSNGVRVSAGGRPLVPAGSPRDLFLYLKPGHVDHAEAVLTDRLAGRATVHRAEQLVTDGFFGPLTDHGRARLPDIVVLPRPYEMVWWSGGGRLRVDKRGMHGGLSADELEIPLLAWVPD